MSGFGPLVTEAGAKSFVLKYRAGSGRAAPTRRVTIGRYGAPWTVEQARAEAKRLLGTVAHGGDPAAALADARRRDAGDTVAAVCTSWLQRDQSGNRTAAEVARIMAREVLPFIGTMPIAEVRKRDIIAIIDRVADRAPVRANRVLAHVKRLFRWATGRDLVEADPAAHVEKPTPERRRERVLGNGELVAVWRAAERMGGRFGAGVRLLVLTAARRKEVFSARWPELDLGTATLRLPAERAKAKEGRTIALSPPALAIIEALPRFAAGDWLLTVNGPHAFSNFGHNEAELDRIAGALLGEPLAPWRLHDIRRTVATGLQRLGVRLEVIEAVLGHVSGSRAGIVGVYQRHRFEAEARQALAAWAAHLQRLLDPTPAAEVVPLRRARWPAPHAALA